MLVTVNPLNDAPVGAPTAVLAVGTEYIAYTVTSASLLAGFTDPDGDALSVTGLTASSGVVTATATSFTITPAANFNGPVTLTYSVSDGQGGSLAAQTRSYNLAAVNDFAAIVGVATGLVTEDGTPTAGGALTVTDSDAGEARFRPVAVDSLTGTYGTFAFDSATGAWTYGLNNAAANVQALTAADTRTDTLTVTSQDGSATQAITVSVRGADEGGVIVGQPGQRIVNGTASAERIEIGASNIVVNAGGGNDVIAIRPGNALQVHLVNGGAGTDTLDLSATSSGANVNLGTGVATGAQIGISILSSIENVIGGSGADFLFGSGGANTMSGGAGNDTITGAGDIDRISGDGGNDRLTGGGVGDWFVFNAPGFGRDTITDFTVAGVHHDVVELNAAVFRDWAAVQVALADSTAGAVLTNGANSITFTGVTKAQIVANHVDDFIFV